jgi:GDPmannose 4,6-dehydratase
MGMENRHEHLLGRTAVITGVNGQDGSYLADFLLSKGYNVIGLKRRTSTINTVRIDHLYENPNFKMLHYDLTDGSAVLHILSHYKPQEFYNLAAQSHVAVSFEIPEYTSDGIAGGTLKILEAIRSINPEIRYYQASSSEMFGDSTDYDPSKGYNEDSRMMPVSPYAVAKLHAHHMTRVYRNAYGLHASCGILFNHESPRRGETFVTRKITMAAARIKMGYQKELRLGNLDAMRDWGFAGDYVEAMWMMLQQNRADDYVIATQETHSVREFLDVVFEEAGLDWQKHVVIDPKYFRPNEVPFLLGDPSKARRVLGWSPKVDMRLLARMMYKSDLALLTKQLQDGAVLA